MSPVPWRRHPGRRPADERGAVAVEHGLLVGAIAAALALAATPLGGRLAALLDSVLGP